MPKIADINAWKAKRTPSPTTPGRDAEYLGYPDENDVGWLPLMFTPYEPDKRFSWKTRRRLEYDFWPIVTPRHAPPVRYDYPELMQKMIDATWRIAEPKDGAERGSAGSHVGLDAPVIGTRATPQDQFKADRPANQTYHQQIRPSQPVMSTIMGNTSAIATDWGLHDNIERVNAVTFRADKRSPHAVITGAGGFFPPNTRKDRYYIENKIAGAFKDYLWFRFRRTVELEPIIRAIDGQTRQQEDLDLAYEYLVWRAILHKESVHLARMVDNEFLKGWSSTSKVLDSSMNFACFGQSPGWVYITVVHSGFVVPFALLSQSETWTSAEAEVAQFGPIPADRIVGFAHISMDKHVDTPIFMRKTFLNDDPKAFHAIFQALSGANSTIL